MDNYVGKRLDGRYEIHEIIGVGGMAVVYKAFDNIDRKVVAVKILKDEYLADEDFKRRFKNESKAIAVLSHPNIVKVLDVSFGDRLQYIVMEYVEGITLKEYIEQQGIVRTREALYFVMQILRALQHAHDKGIVHRDIKPQNIMLIENGSIKVADFGIATFSRGETKTMTNAAIGSVHYISPEQAKGSVTDAKSDIYSVGVVLYEMLTGCLPFISDNAVSVAVMQVQKQPRSPRELNPDIPVGLEQIIMRAMQKNPAERYQSAAEMLVDLSEFGKNPNIKFDYNFFVDKAPTKYIPTNEVKKHLSENDAPAVHPEPVSKENNADEKEEAAEDNSKKKTIGILSGVLGGLIIFVIIMIVVFASGSSKKISVPKFVGLNYTDDIASNDKYNDFNIEPKFVADAEDEDGELYEDGYVFEQSIDEGKKVAENTSIVLQVASNNSKISVPDVYGYDIATAMSVLRREGFLTAIDYDADADTSDGTVIRTSPERNEKAPSGSTITIFIPGEPASSGEMVVVPILVGETLSQAKADLEGVGLELDMSGSTYRDSDKPKGYILGNNLAGQEVPKGTKIAVYMSSGVANHVDVSVTLPNAPTGKGKLVATLNGEKVDSKTVTLDGGSISFKLGGSGSSNSFVVTVDGQKVYSAKINFNVGVAEDEVVFNVKDYTYTTAESTEKKTTEKKTTEPKTTEATVPQSTSESTTAPSTTAPSTTQATETTQAAATTQPQTTSAERPTVDYDEGED